MQQRQQRGLAGRRHARVPRRGVRKNIRARRGRQAEDGQPGHGAERADPQAAAGRAEAARHRGRAQQRAVAE